jgi:DNA-binding transcriptional MerR regulator
MYIDPTTGEEVEQILGEDFNDFELVKMLNGKIVWKWVNEVWEGTKIGSDVYVRLRPKPVQCRSIDNPSLCKLSYTGIAMNVSLMDRMKPLSLLYDIIKYRFNLLLARAKGKGIVVDVHQIPKQLGMDINKVMNFMETTGVLFINSMEEGRGGKVSSFNQFTEFDLSVGQNAAVYMQYMAYIEQTLTNITGIPPAYMGDPTNTNSGVQMEKSIVQSTIVNEHIFYLHNEFKRRALTLLIETAKYVYAGGKKIQYIAEDMSRSFINIEQDDPFCDSEYGVFITNGSKEMSIFEFIKNHATQMGMSAKEILSVLASNSIGESIKTIELAEKIKQQMEKEKQMHEQKLAQINAEAQEKQLKALSDFEIQKQKEKLEFEAKIAREKNDLEETLKKMEMETRLRIAEIQHMNRSY